ncbi:hypothetical protein ACFVGY_27050, partial [Streptomyces sp. NPDC127106]|uniref:hypothetical protein n=1 Tax=Streptomyces sp. NPDC127106 TaxID=3345360 RepID=UPI00362CCBAA
AHVAPRNEREETLASIWKQVLGLERVRCMRTGPFPLCRGRGPGRATGARSYPGPRVYGSNL